MTLKTGASAVALLLALGLSPALAQTTAPSPQAPKATEAPKTPVTGQIVTQELLVDIKAWIFRRAPPNLLPYPAGELAIGAVTSGASAEIGRRSGGDLQQLSQQLAIALLVGNVVDEHVDHAGQHFRVARMLVPAAIDAGQGHQVDRIPAPFP